MSYALSTDGTTIDNIRSRLPGSARLLSTGGWLSPPDGVWTVPQHESCGWYEIVDPGPTHDPATDTIDTRTTEMVAGTPTAVYVYRPLTQPELDQIADDTDRDADEALLPDDFVKAKTERTDAQIERAESDSTNTDPLNPTIINVDGVDTPFLFLPKWTDVDATPWAPVARSGNTVARLNALADAVDLLGARTEDQAKLINLLSTKMRRLWGAIRTLAALLVHLMRADRKDV